MVEEPSESSSPQRSRLGKLEVQTAADAAAQALRDAIITGELKSGERLPEQKWATRFGIGQPTLREALKELEYQGFVQKVGHKGTYVTQLDEEDYRAILEVRIPLEAMALRKAAGKVTPEAEHELSALVMSMAKAGEKNDLVMFHESDVSFHRKIWDLAGNKYLRICLEAVCFRLFVFSVIGRPKSWFRGAVQQHFGILEGLCSRSPDQAQEAFLSNTVQYWNSHYDLDLNLEALRAEVPRQSNPLSAELD